MIFTEFYLVLMMLACLGPSLCAPSASQDGGVNAWQDDDEGGQDGQDAEAGPKCDMMEAVPIIQVKCDVYNNALLKAEEDNNNKELCRQLVNLLKCVADNITVCYDDFHEMHEFYFNSPHFCSPTWKQVRDIQKLIYAKTEKTKTKPTRTPTPPVTTESRPPDVTSQRATDASTTSSSNQSEGGGATTVRSSNGRKVEEGKSGQGYTVSRTGSKEGQRGSKGDKNASSQPSPSLYALAASVSIPLLFGLATKMAAGSSCVR